MENAYKQEIDILLSVVNHLKYYIENEKDYKIKINRQFYELLENWKRIAQFTNAHDLKDYLYMYSNKMIDEYC